MRLQCPTVGCVSTPSEWVYADPVRAASLKTGFQSFPHQAEVISARPEHIHHHGRAHTAHRLKRATKNYEGGSFGKSALVSVNATSFRTFLGQLLLLRPLVFRFHAIHPVA
jgi:hypothetical protein